MISDDQNLMLAESPDVVDSANAEFYAKFPYPWPPMSFPRLEDPDFEVVMLNQSLGDFNHSRMPANANIWVAGCGTNQAVYTALRFPKATVIASDLSRASLEIAATNAATLGITNLTLRQESLNTVTYREEFDYVISTGVIHHNAEPKRALGNIARALRPKGVLELMVYNRFHRTFTTAFQKAVRTITKHNGRASSYEEELVVAKAIAETEPIASSENMAPFRGSHNSKIADALIQPVEYSYTVESLSVLVAECGLQLTLPCYDQFSRARGATWSMQFSTTELQERFDLLPDTARWQIVNLLLLERSPMLWFFVGHRGENNDGRYEPWVNEQFLDCRFVRATTNLRNYVRGARELNYKLSAESVSYPPRHRNDLARYVVGRADGNLTMREILQEAGVNTNCYKTVADLRVHTTTSLCPYLRPTRSGVTIESRA
jgi:SAM-dependent methyltransferase